LPPWPTSDGAKNFVWRDGGSWLIFPARNESHPELAQTIR
jgi:hypothetical protein